MLHRGPTVFARLAQIYWRRLVAPRLRYHPILETCRAITTSMRIKSSVLKSCARRLDDELAHLPIQIDSEDKDPEQSEPLNDNRRSKQRPPIPNYEAVGTTAPSPSERSDTENSSSEREKRINAEASRAAAEKNKSKKRAADPDPFSGASKKKKRATPLWQRLDPEPFSGTRKKKKRTASLWQGPDPDPLSCTGKKKKGTPSLWQRLDNNQATVAPCLASCSIVRAS
jgi:hypothetical protein